ncbi:30S ribosomal protein S17 [Candidatus Sumerlaeota bacterium]|nr:30S ribosomal protein S17 [Candidatus Sumerlaeota bacterium]
MPENKSTQGSRKIRAGRVVSNRMDKTIVVIVERTVRHPLVKKFVRRHKRYYADDPENSCGIGDFVKIVECRPLSRVKRWRLTEIVEKAK